MKRLISILLAVFLIASLTPAALASVETTASVNDSAWLKEVFTANGPTNTSIAPGFTSAYRTSMAVAPVARDSESSDYAYKATVTVNEGTSGNNYADLRFPITKTRVAGKTFKISYDVCFDEFTANGGVALTLAATTYNSAGTGTWPINRSVFVGTDDSKVLTLYGYGDTVINAGEWYHVDHIFNNKTGREDAYITGDNDFYVHTGFSYDATGVDTIERFSLAMKAAGAFAVDNVSISEYSAYFSGVEASYASAGDVEFDVVIPKAFSSAIILCDGQYVTNISSEEGKNCYTVNVSEDDASFTGGTHDISAAITYSDGTTETIKNTIKVSAISKEAIIGSKGTALSTDVEDFNHLGSLATVAGTAPYIMVGTSPVINNTLWQPNTEVYLIDGPSGEAGDYAMSLETIGKLIQIDGPKSCGLSTTPVTSPDGKLVIEYDLYLKSTGVGVQFTPIGSASSANFISGNKILSTIDIPAKTWTKVKMEYDVANSVLNVTAAGKTATREGTLDLDDRNIRFWLRAGKGFAVDNVRTYVSNSDGSESGLLLKDELNYMSTEADTFDSLYSLAKEIVTEDTRTYTMSSTSAVINNTQWQPNGTTKLIYGPSGKDNDFALAVDKSGTLIQYYGMANPAATKGYFVMDFDFCALSSGVQVNSENIGTGAANFASGTSVLGLVPITPGEWSHITLKYDIANGVMYATGNGQTKSKSTAFSMTKGYIRFTLKAGAGFAFDNVKVYNEIPDASVTSAEYVVSGTASAVSNYMIPSTATELKLTTDSALVVSPADVELYIDGEYAEVGTLEANGNVISISLPELKANADLRVVLKDSIAGLTNDVNCTYYVTEADGSYNKIEYKFVDNGMIRSIIRHAGTSTPYAIAATYTGDALSQVKYVALPASSDVTASVVSIAAAETDSDKIMIWDSVSGLKPLVAAQ